MFKITQGSAYFWPVVVEIAQDGGSFQKATLDVQFRRVRSSEFVQIQADYLSGRKSDAALTRDLVVGWRGVQNPDGADVPFSASALDEAIETTPAFAPAVVLAFVASHAGEKEKNSARPPFIG